MKTIIFSILLFLSELCLSQNINGHVINSSLEDASFVSVYLINENDTLKTETDFEGNFRFAALNQDRYNLLIFSVGYIGIDTTLNLNSENMELKIKILNDSSFWPGSSMAVAFNADRARRDILNEDITLLLPGGLVTRAITDDDLEFSKKYNLRLLSRGCNRFNEDDEVAYNKVIFKYLDKKYGKKWRKKIRRDIIGL